MRRTAEQTDRMKNPQPSVDPLPSRAEAQSSLMAGGKPPLVKGPYTSPSLRIGDTVTCAIRGSVEVKGWHDKGSIAIPRGGSIGIRCGLVVCDDLLKALYVETSRAICFYWNIAEPTVARWRMALGIYSRATEGYVGTMSQVGLVNGRAEGVAERLRSMNARPWTPKELALLTTFSTAEVAALTDRSREAVEHARARHSLVQQRDRLTCGVCGYVWFPQNHHVPLRCPKQTCRQLLSQESK